MFWVWRYRSLDSNWIVRAALRSKFGFGVRFNGHIAAGAIKRRAPTERIQRRGRRSRLHRISWNKYGIGVPPTASALPTEDNGDFGTSSFYGQRLEGLTSGPSIWGIRKQSTMTC